MDTSSFIYWLTHYYVFLIGWTKLNDLTWTTHKVWCEVRWGGFSFGEKKWRKLYLERKKAGMEQKYVGWGVAKQCLMRLITPSWRNWSLWHGAYWSMYFEIRSTSAGTLTLDAPDLATGTESRPGEPEAVI